MKTTKISFSKNSSWIHELCASSGLQHNDTSSISGELLTFLINGYNYVPAVNYKISTKFGATLHQAIQL
jgi:hypothetical protein